MAHYFTEEELHDATLAAASQALLSGITTVSDYASVNFSDFALDATCDALQGTHLTGVVVWWNPAAFLPPDIKRAELKRLQEDCGDDIEIWMGPGPLSFLPLPKVYDGIYLAQNLGLRITEHTMENINEQRDLYRFLSDYLRTFGSQLDEQDYQVLQRLVDLGPPSKVDGVRWMRRLARQILAEESNEPKLTDDERRLLQQWIAPGTVSPVPIFEHLDALPGFLSIHSVWLGPGDIDHFKKHGAHVSHNPESNMYLSSGVAPILDYLKSEIEVSLGTDGAASNDGIDFFSAMRGFWNSQKLVTLNTEVMKTVDGWDVLEAATITGARALGIQDRTGSVNEGKEADLVLVSGENLGFSPRVLGKNEVNLLIYSGSARDVDVVISDGEVVVSGEKLTKHSERVLSERLSSIAAGLVKRVEDGKTWASHYNLAQGEIAPYWYKYRSIRPKDIVDLTIENAN